MKEHAKKALKHDFEVAGKTIPTLAIAVLFLVGTGSAALLSSFGTVSGTANVDQPVYISGSADNEVNSAYGIDTVTGGETIVSNSQEIENGLNRTLDVGFDTNILNGTDSGEWHNQSEIEGVETAHVVSRVYNTSGDSYQAGVEPVTGTQYDGGYAVSIESDGSTNDYAKVFFPVTQELSSSATLKFEAEVGEGHTAGALDGDVKGTVDEVYLVTETGELLATHTNEDDDSNSVSLDLSSEFSDADLSSVEAVALGYGDGGAVAGQLGNSQTIDVTVDNVRVESDSETISLDEHQDAEIPILETGKVYDGASTAKNTFHAVTNFEVAVLPQEYETETTLVPQ